MSSRAGPRRTPWRLRRRPSTGPPSRTSPARSSSLHPSTYPFAALSESGAPRLESTRGRPFPNVQKARRSGDFRPQERFAGKMSGSRPADGRFEVAVDFGVFVPQGWRMDLVGIDDPHQQDEAMTRGAAGAGGAGGEEPR